jgi:hypothetical protein
MYQLHTRLHVRLWDIVSQRAKQWSSPKCTYHKTPPPPVPFHIKGEKIASQEEGRGYNRNKLAPDDTKENPTIQPSFPPKPVETRNESMKKMAGGSAQFLFLEIWINTMIHTSLPLRKWKERKKDFVDVITYQQHVVYARQANCALRPTSWFRRAPYQIKILMLWYTTAAQWRRRRLCLLIYDRRKMIQTDCQHPEV